MRTIVLVLLSVMLGSTAKRVSAADIANSPATGDQHRTYVFARTGDRLPYRLFVPRSYRGDKPYPLVVVLHGGGASEDRPMEGTGLKEIAAERGYIVLSPLGYNRFGGYGNIYPVVVTPKTAAGSIDFPSIARAEGPGKPASAAAPSPKGPLPPGPPPSPATEDEYYEQPAGTLSDARIAVLSEEEILAAIADVEKEYRIDKRRSYMMGNSAGGVGTLYLAAKYPAMWAAIAPQGGVIAAWSYPYWRLRDARIPVLFVHGALDEHCNAKWSHAMMQAALDDNVDASLLIVPGGTHGRAWTQVLPQIFDFFDSHAKPPSTAGAAVRAPLPMTSRLDPLK